MKIFKAFWQLSLGAVALFVLTYHPNIILADDDSRSVFFYEINWAGSSRETYRDKWLVLKNNTTKNINLSDEKWKIAKSEGQIILDLEGEIKANGYFLISRYADDVSALNIIPDQQSSSVSWDNKAFELKLFKDQVLQDEAGSGGTFFTKTNPLSSMVRVSPQSDGRSKESWFTNQNRANLDDGVLDFGTPKIGVPYVTVEGWQDLAAIGTGFDATISISHPNNSETLTILENGVTIASGLNPGDRRSVNVMCPSGPGDNTINIEVVDSIGMKYSMEGKLYCYQFADLEISEVVPAPKSGEEEWIEIYNPSKDAINLKYWRLADVTHNELIDDDVIVPARGYITLKGDNLYGITLNNNGDTITISSPKGDETSGVSWDDSQSALSYAKFGNTYKWTSKPTPGKANIYQPLASTNDDTARPSSIPEIKTSDASKNINKWVTVEGEIVENKGDTFYIDDGSGRVKVYIQSSTRIDKPSMHKGDIFRVTGIVNIYRNGEEPRLLPKSLNDIELIQSAGEDEGEDTSDEVGLDSKISGSSKFIKANKSTISTKKVLGNPQLLAAVVKPFSLPKLPTKISLSDVSPSAPILPTGETIAELTIGGVGLLAIAKILKGVVELWL